MRKTALVLTTVGVAAAVALGGCSSSGGSNNSGGNNSSGGNSSGKMQVGVILPDRGAPAVEHVRGVA